MFYFFSIFCYSEPSSSSSSSVLNASSNSFEPSLPKTFKEFIPSSTTSIDPTQLSILDESAPEYYEPNYETTEQYQQYDDVQTVENPYIHTNQTTIPIRTDANLPEK
jgi:hypothetical protein